MRVLIVTVAEKTNFLNMVPLGWALVDAGHEVRVASQPELMDVVADTGLTGVPVGKDHNFWRIMNAFRSRHTPQTDVPLFRRALGPMEEITWEQLRYGYGEVVPWWWRTVNDPMVDDLVTYCRQWEPDLVIWEPIAFAAPIAAKACGIPHARFLWGVDLMALMRSHFLKVMQRQPLEEREDKLAEWLGNQVARFGGTFSESMVTGDFTLDYVPESLLLDLDEPPERLPLRFVPYNGRSVLPQWLREPPERPRVCLTLGTSATERQGGYVVSVSDLLESLSELDVEVVATLPKRERLSLGLLPRNVRTVRFAPLHALLPTCAATINHGGAGTVFASLEYGVPQLILPRPQFDEQLLARQVGSHGAGLVISSAEATVDRVREAMSQLLHEPRFQQRTDELRDQMHSHPDPNRFVSRLEEAVEGLVEQRSWDAPSPVP